MRGYAIRGARQDGKQRSSADHASEHSIHASLLSSATALTRGMRASYAACNPAIDRSRNEPNVTPYRRPDRLLLLYTDRTDAVSRVLLEQPDRFGREVVAIRLDELVAEVHVDGAWTWRGQSIDPTQTAVVNRLVMPAVDDGAGPFETLFAQRQFWRWLGSELRRFAYVSSLPTATSLIGDFGSLLDQWLDLPALLPGLRVPTFKAPWIEEAPSVDTYRVDPYRLYSLGTQVESTDANTRAHLTYQRPRAPLIHVAQVGGLLLFGPMPPEMDGPRQSAIVAFAHALAARSNARILEHAFFIGDGAPIFYSTCPFPVITGSLRDYPDLLIKGLQDDIDRRCASDAS
jgi:hypothetical protein